MNTNEFRAELQKIMPGYQWTVKRPYTDGQKWFTATGIQSAVFNRTSTLEVTRRVEQQTEDTTAPTVNYEVRLFGSGMRGPSRSSATGATLAKALRYTQDHCEAMAGEYAGCLNAMRVGRANPSEGV